MRLGRAAPSGGGGSAVVVNRRLLVGARLGRLGGIGGGLPRVPAAACVTAVTAAGRSRSLFCFVGCGAAFDKNLDGVVGVAEREEFLVGDFDLVFIGSSRAAPLMLRCTGGLAVIDDAQDLDRGMRWFRSLG
jgi:hypothetical protein